MKKFLRLTVIMGIMIIAFAIVNISYADEELEILTPSDLITQSTSTTTTTTTTTTQTTLDLTTKTTATTSAKTTSTTLPHTGIEDSTGTIVAIVALAIVGATSFVVIKKNSDI